MRSTLNARRLQKLNWDLKLRLPSLMRIVRVLRRMPNDQDVKRRAMCLATEMLALEDQTAETGVLRNVHVEPTADSFDHEATPYSIRFNDFDEFDSIVHYWGARIWCIRLYLITNELIPTSKDFKSKLKSLRSELWRMATNIIMSWQFARELGLFATPNMLDPFINVWSVLADCTDSSKDRSIMKLRPWILHCMGRCGSWSKPNWTADDLTAAAGVLIGEPVGKRFLDAFDV